MSVKRHFPPGVGESWWDVREDRVRIHRAMAEPRAGLPFTRVP